MIHQRNNASNPAATAAATPVASATSSIKKTISRSQEPMLALSPPLSTKTKKHLKGLRRRKKDYLATLFIYASVLIATFWLFSLYTFEQHIHKEYVGTSRSKDGTSSVKLTSKDLLPEGQKIGEKNSAVAAGKQHNHDHDDPTAFLTMYGRHRFHDSYRSLPKWLQEYFTWHRLQTTTNQTNTEYLVLTCLPKDDCGGLSDRFRALPFYLFVAKYTRRVLCIHWVKNFGLQEFLQPIPDVGIEWRCPAELNHGFYDLNRGSKKQKIKMWKFAHCHNMEIPMATCFEGDIGKANALFRGKYATVGMVSREPERINKVNLLVQRHSYGGAMAGDGAYYMPGIYNWQHAEMIGDIFRVMFEPILPLAKRINATMSNLGLVENEFISVHVRIRYPTSKLRAIVGHLDFDKDGGLDFQNKAVKSYAVDIINNALECGHMLAPDLKKIFFVSDHNEATRFATTNEFTLGKRKNTVGNEVTLRPLGIDRNKEPLHMEGNHSSNAIDFFPVFEDLLIMGGSRCVSHGIGSFGSFGAALSSGNKCRAIHRRFTGRKLECPNEISLQDPVVINATEMAFGEKPGGEGKLTYDVNQYVQLPMAEEKSDNGKK